MTDQLSLKRQEAVAALFASATISAAARAAWTEGDPDAEQNRLVVQCRRPRARYARDAYILPFPDIVTQRGNNRQRVFLTDEDRQFYLEALRRKCRDHGLRLLDLLTHVESRPSGLDARGGKLARRSLT